MKERKTSAKGRPARVSKSEKGGALVPIGEAVPMRTQTIGQVSITEPVHDFINLQKLMEQAIERQVSIDYMKELVALFEQIQAKVAEKDFNDCLAAAQAEFPIIEKKAEARDHTKCDLCKNTGLVRGQPCPGGKLLYVYAPHEDIVEKIGPILARHGFSATTKAKGFVHAELKVPFMAGTCILRHRGGHVVETTIEIPIGEGTHLMSPMQKYMAARSFAIRYAYMGGTGVVGRGENVETPEEPPAEPRAVGGVPVDELGVRVPAAKEDKKPEPPKTQKVVAGDIKEARASLQGLLNQMGQIYSKGWTPLVDKEGSPIISETMARRLFPNEGPYNVLFSDEELAAYQKDGKSVWGDVAALESKFLDWTAALADRKVELLGKAGM